MAKKDVMPVCFVILLEALDTTAPELASGTSAVVAEDPTESEGVLAAAFATTESAGAMRGKNASGTSATALINARTWGVKADDLGFFDLAGLRTAFALPLPVDAALLLVAAAAGASAVHAAMAERTTPGMSGTTPVFFSQSDTKRC